MINGMEKQKLWAPVCQPTNTSTTYDVSVNSSPYQQYDTSTGLLRAATREKRAIGKGRLGFTQQKHRKFGSRYEYTEGTYYTRCLIV